MCLILKQQQSNPISLTTFCISATNFLSSSNPEVMLCSISTAKSGLNWLDRLRSSKGFPAGNDLDLEHFLNHHNHDPSNSPNTDASDPKSNYGSSHSDEKSVPKRNQTTEISTDNGEKEWFGIMSNVLSELFIMGDSNEISRFSGKKSTRKQRNPKSCVLSPSTSGDERCLNDIRRNEGVLTTKVPSSGEISLMEMKDASGEVKLKKEGNGDSADVEEEEKCNGDLLGYSQSEVTIIDTSFASWKVEKLLFRRKNVWKVRDKKGEKSTDVDGKKRKASLCDQNVGGKKKIKLSISQFGLSKNENGKECFVPSNKGKYPKNDERKGAPKKIPDILRQVPKKRFPFPRLARNQEREAHLLSM